MKDLTAGDFSEVFDLENLTDLNNTDDLIGAVLRIHFAIESLLKIWCSKIVGCEDFFDFDRTFSFSLKLKISQKLGLPSELADVFGKLNTIRNKFAHMIITTISDEELNEICDAIDGIPLGDSYATWCVKDVVKTDQGHPTWNTPNISITQKLLVIHLGLMTKVLIIFRDEFEKRGIEFSF